MEIKKFKDFIKSDNTNENLNITDDDILGLDASVKSGAYSGQNRRNQYFYDYYTGRKVSGMPKYELNSKIFQLAKQKDEIGLLAQFCLQIERESISHDYDLSAMISELSKNKE